MDNLHFNCIPRALSGKLHKLALVAGLAMSLMMGAAQAQHDFIHTFMNILQQGMDEAKKYGAWVEKQGADYKEFAQLVQKYQSTLMKIKNLQSTINMPEGATLQEVDEDTFMVEETCGEPYGGGARGAIGQLTKIDLRGKVFQQQYTICATTQKMRNRQFNEMVQYLTKTIGSMRKMDKEWDDVFASIKNSGDVKGSTATAQNSILKMDAATAEFKSRMSAYDTYIAEQDNVQAGLARGAMRGDAGPLRSVTDAAVMRTALCAGNRCK